MYRDFKSSRLGGAILKMCCVVLAACSLSTSASFAEDSKPEAIVILAILDKALRQNPDDRDLLYALASFERDYGRLDSALTYARRLHDIAPQDHKASVLLRELEEQFRQ